MSSSQLKWDEIYRHKADTDPMPASMLSQYSHLLPQHGLALDLACGLGGNTFFLAEQGLQVDAWDISSVAIERIKSKTEARNIQALSIDICDAPFPKNHYDVIAVSRFLERQIIPQLIDALKVGGLIFYQTFTLDKAQSGGPSNPKFLLQKAELLSLFSSLSPIIYHEEGAIGDTSKGIRNEAILIAQRL